MRNNMDKDKIEYVYKFLGKQSSNLHASVQTGLRYTENLLFLLKAV